MCIILSFVLVLFYDYYSDNMGNNQSIFPESERYEASPYTVNFIVQSNGSPVTLGAQAVKTSFEKIQDCYGSCVSVPAAVIDVEDLKKCDSTDTVADFCSKWIGSIYSKSVGKQLSSSFLYVETIFRPVKASQPWHLFDLRGRDVKVWNPLKSVIEFTKLMLQHQSDGGRFEALFNYLTFVGLQFWCSANHRFMRYTPHKAMEETGHTYSEAFPSYVFAMRQRTDFALTEKFSKRVIESGYEAVRNKYEIKDSEDELSIWDLARTVEFDVFALLLIRSIVKHHWLDEGQLWEACKLALKRFVLNILHNNRALFFIARRFQSVYVERGLESINEVMKKEMEIETKPYPLFEEKTKNWYPQNPYHLRVWHCSPNHPHASALVYLYQAINFHPDQPIARDFPLSPSQLKSLSANEQLEMRMDSVFWQLRWWTTSSLRKRIQADYNAALAAVQRSDSKQAQSVAMRRSVTGGKHVLLYMNPISVSYAVLAQPRSRSVVSVLAAPVRLVDQPRPWHIRRQDAPLFVNLDTLRFYFAKATDFEMQLFSSFEEWLDQSFDTPNIIWRARRVECKRSVVDSAASEILDMLAVSSDEHKSMSPFYPFDFNLHAGQQIEIERRVSDSKFARWDQDSARTADVYNLYYWWYCATNSAQFKDSLYVRQQLYLVLYGREHVSYAATFAEFCKIGMEAVLSETKWRKKGTAYLEKLHEDYRKFTKAQFDLFKKLPESPVAGGQGAYNRSLPDVKSIDELKQAFHTKPVFDAKFARSQIPSHRAGKGGRFQTIVMVDEAVDLLCTRAAEGRWNTLYSCIEAAAEEAAKHRYQVKPTRKGSKWLEVGEFLHICALRIWLRSWPPAVAAKAMQLSPILVDCMKSGKVELDACDVFLKRNLDAGCFWPLASVLDRAVSVQLDFVELSTAPREKIEQVYRGVLDQPAASSVRQAIEDGSAQRGVKRKANVIVLRNDHHLSSTRGGMVPLRSLYQTFLHSTKVKRALKKLEESSSTTADDALFLCAAVQDYDPSDQETVAKMRKIIRNTTGRMGGSYAGLPVGEVPHPIETQAALAYSNLQEFLSDAKSAPGEKWIQNMYEAFQNSKNHYESSISPLKIIANIFFKLMGTSTAVTEMIKRSLSSRTKEQAPLSVALCRILFPSQRRPGMRPQIE